ncbi:hypothetical protein MVEN_00911700 [Mycena venus]|uniref:Uncharacterized protein n=1 Tax=Mycena venus TaxID=2733690 RepID=A0A8H6YCJ8_9AGAR|nr:hypothetical protein MVEN_00911700 [Mycena venus]
MVAYAYNYLLASTWINSMLYTLELVLAVRYFQHSSRPLLHRVGIGAILASDTLCTFAIWAKLYILVSLFSLQAAASLPGFRNEDACRYSVLHAHHGINSATISLFPVLQASVKAGDQCHSSVQHPGSLRTWVRFRGCGHYNRAALRMG